MAETLSFPAKALQNASNLRYTLPGAQTSDRPQDAPLDASGRSFELTTPAPGEARLEKLSGGFQCQAVVGQGRAEKRVSRTSALLSCVRSRQGSRKRARRWNFSQACTATRRCQ